MSESNSDHSNGRSDNQSHQPNHGHIFHAHIALYELVLGFIAAILFAIGTVGWADAQLRFAGIFIFIGGCLTASFVVFLHVRHKFLGKKVPAILRMMAFSMCIGALVGSGATLWQEKSSSHLQLFNTLIGSGVASDPDKTTGFFSADILDSEIVIRPTNFLVILHITNNQNVEGRISGLTLETSDSPWTPFWTKLCRVDLSASRLGYLLAEDKVTFFDPTDLLDPRLTASPIPPHATVTGWTAWNCPKDRECASNKLRIGLADASGNVTYQILSRSDFPANINLGRLTPIETIHLDGKKLREASSPCE